MNEVVDSLNTKYKNKDTQEVLIYFLQELKGIAHFSSSFGLEDQVITNLLYETNMLDKVEVFTLDTGRLPYETYDVMHETKLKYTLELKVLFPKYESVEHLYEKQGINGFYNSIDNRKECCYVRKLEPLNRALEGASVWVTGIRAQQSVTRENMQLFEWDEERKLIKFNPLLYWSEEEVLSCIKTNNIPYNKLHDRGYPSIGCAPCTRSVAEGEDIRSGRWWWESPEHKECGLHKR